MGNLTDEMLSTQIFKNVYQYKFKFSNIQKLNKKKMNYIFKCLQSLVLLLCLHRAVSTGPPFDGNLNEATLINWGIGYQESEIYLSEKRIKSIDPDTFKNYTRVFVLDLSRNQITFIQPGTFSTLTSLVSLLLNNNQITSIDPQTFSNQNYLVYLYLFNNQISSIHHQTFKELAYLRTLLLDNNNIASFESGTFNGLT